VPFVLPKRRQPPEVGAVEEAGVCLVASGDVLVAFPMDNELVQRVGYQLCERHRADLLTEAFRQLTAPFESPSLSFTYPYRREVARIRVPAGTEAAAAQRLHREFLEVALSAAQLPGGPAGVQTPWGLLGTDPDDPPFAAEPNPILPLAASSRQPDDFVLDTTTHAAALSLLNLPATPVQTTSTVKVGIIDSGVASSATPPNTVAKLNVFEWDDAVRKNNVEDGHGHGTRIAEIVKSIVPGAEFLITRVTDDSGCTTSWHMMLAIACVENAHVVNLSIASEIDPGTFPCRKMGEHAASMILESVVRDLRAHSGAILVAAAGNDGATELSFPARYREAVAIVSVNTSGQLSAFSNRGVLDHVKAPHPYVFAAPGGDGPLKGRQQNVKVEMVGTSKDGRAKDYGTSYAAAYATGVIATYVAANPAIQPSAALSDLITAAAGNRNSTWYIPQQHGNGIIQLP
jgi:subtilisin family serine protease